MTGKNGKRRINDTIRITIRIRKRNREEEIDHLFTRFSQKVSARRNYLSSIHSRHNKVFPLYIPFLWVVGTMVFVSTISPLTPCPRRFSTPTQIHVFQRSYLFTGRQFFSFGQERSVLPYATCRLLGRSFSTASFLKINIYVFPIKKSALC